MSKTVHVKNIAAETTEKEVRDFFTFCGRISNLSIKTEGSTQVAHVTFEKETAAKTALLLDNTQLEGSQVTVEPGPDGDERPESEKVGAAAGSGASKSTSGTTGSSSTTSTSTDEKKSADNTSSTTGTTSTSSDEHHDLSQEDKPRSRVIAEMLAHGYVIGDAAIQRAVDLDGQHGISTRFTNALQQFDARFKATETAQNIDQKYNISQRAADGWKSLYSYFDQAQETPTGQRLRAFYDQGQKQVLDVHNEARHLAALKTGKKPEDLGKPVGTAAASEKA